MSQHYFQTTHAGRAVEILAGFDRPLQGFFCVVSYIEHATAEMTDADADADAADHDDDDDDDDESDGYLYCNLEDPDLFRDMGMSRTPDHFVAKLAELGLSMPPAMLSEIVNDALGNVGNRQVRYDSEGRLVPPADASASAAPTAQSAT